MVDVIDKPVNASPSVAQNGWLNDARRRIVTTRYVLAASVVLLCGLALFERLSWLDAAQLSGVMVVIAAISPVRTARARKQEQADLRPVYDYTIANSMLDALQEPLVVLDERGTIQFASQSAINEVGKLSVGSSALLRFRSPELQEMIQEALAGGNPTPSELRERGSNDRFFQVSSFRLPAEVGPQYRVCLHFTDSTQAHVMERMRSDFVANASHELRTPLASLTGYIETLAGPAKNDKAAQARFLPIMLEQTERMSRLVNDLLHLSRYETARGVSEYQPVDVRDVLIHVANAVKPLGDSQGSEIILQNAERIDKLMVRGDREELIQLFENLVENAIKYGGAGKPVRIDVKQSTLDGVAVWQVAIIDQGPGIPPEHLPRLTERFYRVDVQESRGKQGTGLGLAIAKHVTTRHDGKLQIRSTLGVGSTFTVSLPRLD